MMYGYGSGGARHPFLFAVAFWLAVTAGGAPSGLTQEGNMATTPLALQTPVDRELAAGGSHSYEFDVAAGDFLRVAGEQLGIDIELRWYDPQGGNPYKADSPTGNQGTEVLVAIAGAAGRGRLDVVAVDPSAAPARYRLTLTDHRPATADDLDVVAADQLFREAEKLKAPATAEHARDLYQQVLTTVERLGPPERVGEALWGLGRAQEKLSDYAGALASYRQALATFRQLNHPTYRAALTNSTGWMCYRVGLIAEALQLFEEAVPLFAASGNQGGVAIALGRAGNMHDFLGETQQALSRLQQAVAIARQVGDGRLLGWRLNSQAPVLLALNRPQEAFAACEEALSLHEAAVDREGMAVDLKGMGEALIELERPAEAVPYLEQALQILRDDDLNNQFSPLNGLANAYLKLNDLERAGEYFQQAQQLVEQVGEPRSRAIVWQSSALFELVSGSTENANEFYRRARELFLAAGDPRGQASSLAGSARALHDLGRYAEARAAITAALKLVETLRLQPDSSELRISYFANRQNYYDVAIDVLVHLGESAAALLVNERRLARALLDRLAETGADVRAGVDPELLARERSVQRQLNERARQPALAEGEGLDQLSAELADVRGAIRRASPRYAALTFPEPLAPADVQSRVLDDDTLLLVYALGEERSFLWWVSRDEVGSHELPPRAEIESTARRFSELLTREVLTLGRERAGAALSELLLSPAAPVLGRRRLVFVTEGALQSVAFAALPEPGQGSHAAPLVAQHEVVMLPSVSVLAALRHAEEGRPAPGKTLAVFADPVFESGDPRLAGSSGAPAAPPQDLISAARSAGIDRWDRLTYTAQEAKAILARVPPGEGFLAAGFAADRAQVLAGELSDYRILHFATHGLMNDEHPELSGLVLSLVDEQGQPCDGFLRAHEISNLELSAELVVLSACQTGVGKDVRGEGLLSLTRSFMYAGVPRVLVTLWKVDDQGTAEMMSRFYHALLHDGVRPAAALRQAQLSMLAEERWSSPRLWAGFVLQGDWR